MLGRLARVMIRRPLGTLAVLTVAGAWGAISVNALLLQEGPHPAPLLGRDQRQALTVLPQPSPAHRVASVDPVDHAAELDRRAAAERAALIVDIQSALARRNFYHGALDGVFGPRTEAAIRDYELAAGLAPTGQPSAELLAHVRLSTLTAPPVPPPHPLRQTAVAAPEMEAPTPTDAAAPPPRQAAGAAAEAAPAPIPVRTVTIAGAGDPVAELLAQNPLPPAPLVDGRIQSVQRVLAELGYAPGSIDGQLSSATRRAIEDFQIDRGLPVTGEISPRFLDELSAVSGVRL
jgi:peptidoglycan hydrolase-like protein with peptidoglycan-binding domain